MLFKDVICPQHTKTVWLRADGQVETTILRTLVFLKVPEPGAMRDVVARVPNQTAVMYESADARGLERKSSAEAAYVYWTPRGAVTPYAVYDHQLRWTSPGPTREPAIYTDIHCETRTGILAVEIVTPAMFEAAIVFKRPRWRSLTTEQSLMKQALKQLESGGAKPTLTENGVPVAVARPRTTHQRALCVRRVPRGGRRPLAETPRRHFLHRTLETPGAARSSLTAVRGSRFAVRLFSSACRSRREHRRAEHLRGLVRTRSLRAPRKDR